MCTTDTVTWGTFLFAGPQNILQLCTHNTDEMQTSQRVEGIKQLTNSI